MLDVPPEEQLAVGMKILEGQCPWCEYVEEEELHCGWLADHFRMVHGAGYWHCPLCDRLLTELRALLASRELYRRHLCSGECTATQAAVALQALPQL